VPRASKTSAGAPVLRDMQDLWQRLGRLEEKAEEPIADSLKHTQVAICDAVMQVSELMQRTAKSDRQLVMMQERLDQLQPPRQGQDSLSRINKSSASVASRVSQQVTHAVERLLDFESLHDVEQVRQHRWHCGAEPEFGVSRELEPMGDRSKQVDQALQRLQGACSKAADDIANTVRQELQNLQGKQDVSWEGLSISQQPESLLESSKSDTESCSRAWTP